MFGWDELRKRSKVLSENKLTPGITQPISVGVIRIVTINDLFLQAEQTEKQMLTNAEFRFVKSKIGITPVRKFK